MNTSSKSPSSLPRKTNEYSVSYWHQRPFWTDCLNLKEPLPETLGLYLFRYPKEDDDEFAQRLKRIAQVNFVHGVIEFYCAMLFSTNVQISSAKYKDEVNSFITSCTPQGDSLVDFTREIIAPNALLYGVTDVFVDKPSTDQEIVTQADQQSSGVNQPYVYVVPPLNRMAWELDASKNYTYYMSVDVINTQVAAQMGINDSKQYRQWSLDRVILMDSDGGKEPSVSEDKANPYGFIPAVSVIPIPSMRFFNDRMGLSLVQDIVRLQKLVLNLISLQMDFHENVNFAQRVIIQDTDNDDQPPEEGDAKEVGNKRGLVLYGKGSRYDLATPNPTGVQAMLDFLNRIVGMIFQSVYMDADENQNKTHQTGQTIRSNNARLYNSLTKISRHFEKALKQIIEMSLKIRGIDPMEAQVSVQWDCNFSYEAFLTAVEELKALRQAVGDLSKTAVKEYAKRVVGPKLYNSGKLPEIIKEIDAFTGAAALDEAAPDNVQKENREVDAVEKAESDESD